ncbi:MAG: glycosyltransferase family 2 protein [Actinomycetota bacterium]|nr:glycosyltransferase family 2 protein [Actinomycetota bacterium]
MRATLQAGRETCERMVASSEISDYELLVVDDASTDSTGKIADELAADDPRIRVVHHERNRTLGGCIKTGFAAARGDVILYTDADLPCDVAEASKACRLMRHYDADIVSAYRHDRTGEGPRRAAYSWIYNWLIRLVFGVYVRDVNFAFKLCRRSVFDRMQLVSEGSFIDAELLVRADRLGLKVIQFGVDYFPRSHGVSTLSSGAVIRKILAEMVALRGELSSSPASKASASGPGTSAGVDR